MTVLRIRLWSKVTGSKLDWCIFKTSNLLFVLFWSWPPRPSTLCRHFLEMSAQSRLKSKFGNCIFPKWLIWRLCADISWKCLHRVSTPRPRFCAHISWDFPHRISKKSLNFFLGLEVSQKASKPASKQASKPASQQASKPAGQQASKPASQQASQPASQQASKPASQPASKQSWRPVGRHKGGVWGGDSPPRK